jgi:hypothetical protein
MTTLRNAVQEFIADYDCDGCGHFAAYAERFRKLLAQQTQTPCDIAEDGVCEVIDCCRNRSQILEALEIGYDSAQAEAAQYHAAMAGYRPERHAAMDADVQKIAEAITALRAALEQQDEPKGGGNLPPPLQAEPVEEPVAWRHKGAGHFTVTPLVSKFPEWEPLYTHPPRREWKSLTEEEIDRWTPEIHTVIRAVEQALKEKNA